MPTDKGSDPLYRVLYETGSASDKPELSPFCFVQPG